MNDIGKISHVLKHSHRRCEFSAFDKFLHEGYPWNGTWVVLSFVLYKKIFLHFLHHGTNFYDKYINTDDRKQYIDDDGSGVFPKHKDRKLYNAKYQESSIIKRHVVSEPHIKDTIISMVY